MEGKRVGREAGGDEGGSDGGGAGEDGEFDFLIAAGFEKTMSGVGEAGGAGIGNDCDFHTVFGTLDEFGNALLFIVVVQRNEGT